MTLLTKQEIEALLDGTTPGPWEKMLGTHGRNKICATYPCINGLSALFTIADVNVPEEIERGYTDDAFNPDVAAANTGMIAAAPDLARALLQARADAAAAVALAYEAAAEFVGNEAPSFPDNVAWCVEDLAKAVRALAPDAGTAELAKLRERAEKAEQERVAEWNRRRDADGSRDAARAACDTMRAERDTLAAELAQADLRAKNAYMRGLLDSAQHLRSTIPDNPDSWEQVESMARMLDTMATLEAARHIAEGQTRALQATTDTGGE